MIKISSETAERIYRIENTSRAIDEMISVCRKYQEEALAKRYVLDMAGVPLDHESRVFEVDDAQWIEDMSRLGMVTFFGLLIKMPALHEQS